MKRTVMENINPPYTLHDMNIIGFERDENKITLHTQSGMVSTAPPLYGQVDGYVEFYDVDWDFSYVYIIDFTNSYGPLTGRKVPLADFIAGYVNTGFSVMDEMFGFNQTQFSGYLSQNRGFYDCILTIYHKGDRVYTEVGKLNNDM